MKFEIKPINIKERTITVRVEVNEYSDDFKEQVKDFMEDTPTFKESEAIKLFNHLYENSPVDLVGFNHLGEYGERQNTTFSFETAFNLTSISSLYSSSTWLNISILSSVVKLTVK